MRFTCRGEAGGRLAVRLGRLRLERPVVVAVPMGGVPVAFEVARRLGASLDIVGVHVLEAPLRPAVAIGAVGEEQVRVLDGAVGKRLHVVQSWLEQEIRHVTDALCQQVRWLRDGLPCQAVAGRVVVLVDDGTAGGLTVSVAVEVLRRRGASRVVLATPVATVSLLRALSDHVDDVVCLARVSSSQAIRRSYRDFRPVSGNKVRRLLAIAAGLRPDIACQIPLREDRCLMGNLAVPVGATGLVIFPHNRTGRRCGPGHRALATHLGDVGMGTLLVDLLTDSESAQYTMSFDTRLLADRLIMVTRWATAQTELRHLPVSYLALGSDVPPALVAAADANLAHGLVCVGGRPRQAVDWLARVRTPTLLIVGSRDITLRRENVAVSAALGAEAALEIVAGATQPFDSSASEQVAELAASWFARLLPSSRQRVGDGVGHAR